MLLLMRAISPEGIAKNCFFSSLSLVFLSFVCIYSGLSITKTQWTNGPFDECIDVLIFICSLFNTLTNNNKCDKFFFCQDTRTNIGDFLLLFEASVGFFQVHGAEIEHFCRLWDLRVSKWTIMGFNTSRQIESVLETILHNFNVFFY